MARRSREGSALRRDRLPSRPVTVPRDRSPRRFGGAWAAGPRGRGAIGAVPEQVEPNAEALLFDPFSVEDLRRALRMFIADPSRYTPSGEQGWGWPEHVQTLTELYQEALGSERRRR